MDLIRNGFDVPDTIKTDQAGTKCIKLEDWKTRAIKEPDSKTEEASF